MSEGPPGWETPVRQSLVRQIDVLGVPLPWVLILGLGSYLLTVLFGKPMLNVPLGLAAIALRWAFVNDPLVDLVFTRNKGRKLWVQ